MKKVLAILISTVVFFGIYILVSYLMGEEINWLMTGIATGVFLVIDTIAILTRKEKTK